MTNQQNNQAVFTKKNLQRRLDHLADLQSGKVAFTMIPYKVIQMFMTGVMPVAKFRLLCHMLSHSKSFHIKSAYLRKNFSPKTLTRYIKELIAEGYITREEISVPTGNVAVVYHVNSLSDWQIFQGVDFDPEPEPEIPDDDPGDFDEDDEEFDEGDSTTTLGNTSSQGNSSLGNGLNINQANQIKSPNLNEISLGSEASEASSVADKSATSETVTEGGEISVKVGKKSYRYRPEYLDFAKEQYDWAKENHAYKRRVDLRAWANDVRLILDAIGRDFQTFASIVRWARSDDFWSTNVVSIPGLRKTGSNGELKILNIINAIKRINRAKMKAAGGRRG